MSVDFTQKNAMRKLALKKWGKEVYKQGRVARKLVCNGGAFGKKEPAIFNLLIKGTMGTERDAS